MPTTMTPANLDVLAILATQASMRHIEADGDLTLRIKAIAEEAFRELDSTVLAQHGFHVGDRVHIGLQLSEQEPEFVITDYVIPGGAAYPWFLLAMTNKNGKPGKRTALYPLGTAFRRA